jgi:hypothetical protein
LLLLLIHGLCFNSKSSDENDILHAAEFIKEVAPSEGELHNGLTRLLDAGLIEEDGGRYAPRIWQ